MKRDRVTGGGCKGKFYFASFFGVRVKNIENIEEA
jgi:hypothetical protein